MSFSVEYRHGGLWERSWGTPVRAALAIRMGAPSRTARPSQANSPAKLGVPQLLSRPPLLRDCRLMCGICGMASANGAPDVGAVGRMSARLVHRGPDDD